MQIAVCFILIAIWENMYTLHTKALCGCFFLHIIPMSLLGFPAFPGFRVQNIHN